jgi:hypothetical protein
VAAVAQLGNVQLPSVTATLEGGIDVQGILGMDSDVRNGSDGVKVLFDSITNPTGVSVSIRRAPGLAAAADAELAEPPAGLSLRRRRSRRLSDDDRDRRVHRRVRREHRRPGDERGHKAPRAAGRRPRRQGPLLRRARQLAPGTALLGS